MKRLPGIIAAALLSAGCASTSLAQGSAAEIDMSAEAEDTWRTQIDSFAQKTLIHPAWGYSHSVRNYRLARELAAADSVALDDDVLYAAAMLHDIAAFPAYAKEGEDHADRAAALVPDILAEAGFPLDKVPQVQAAIRSHMFFRDPEGPEAIYLHDADALDWLGAIGVARLTATIDMTGATPGAPPNGATVAQALAGNLQAVPPRVVSPAGKALLPGRIALLTEYLANLAKETDDFETL